MLSVLGGDVDAVDVVDAVDAVGSVVVADRLWGCRRLV